MSRTPLRLRTAALAAAPAAVAGTAAAFLAPQVGPAAAAGVGLLGAAASAAAAWVGFAPVARLAAAGGEVAGGKRSAADLPASPGELAGVAELVRELDRRRSSLEAAYRADLSAVAAALDVLADPKATPTAPTVVGPDTAAAARLKAAFDAAAKDATNTRGRLGSTFRVLAGMPDAVVAADGSGQVRYVNPAAEKLFRLTAAVAARRTLPGLFVDPAATPAGDDPDRAPLTPAGVGGWLANGAPGAVLARAAGGAVVELTAVAPTRPGRDGMIVLVARDATSNQEWDTADRAIIRANAARRVLDRYLAESEPGLEQLSAQLRLLTGDAKQSGLRDGMMGKVTAAAAGLKRLETYFALAHWFRRAAWDELPDPTPSEFTAVEVVNAVADKLAGRLKGRGNAIKVQDAGGWLFADADRLEAALLGLLVHACDACSNAQLVVRVSRLPVGPGRPQAATEFHLPDAGPALSADQLDVLARPFGGYAPAPLDRFPGSDGNPLGLAVAAKLAPALDGELLVSTGPAGQLELRLVVPTRRASDVAPVTVAAAAPGALDVAPVEETVMGWRLGAPAPQMPA